MYRQSPRSRGQRANKGFKVKHALQLILLLGVGIWLLYQTQRSYSNKKDKSLGEGAKVSERLRLGRKDLPDLGEASSGIDKRIHERDDVKFGGNEDAGRSEEEGVNASGSERKEDKEKGGGVESNGSEKRDVVENKEKENGGNDVNKGEVKNEENEKKQGGKGKVGKEGSEESKEKVGKREGRGKGAVEDAKIENPGSSNGQVQDGVGKDDKVVTGEHEKGNDSSSSADGDALGNSSANVKSSKKESNVEGVSDADAAKIEFTDSKSAETFDSSEDKQVNMTAFSDETFASHGQNETVDNMITKTEKGETGADSYQSDSNVDSTSKTGDSNSVEGGDSTTFSDTNGNEEVNGVENPGSSSLGTNEKVESDQPNLAHSSHHAHSQEQKLENTEKPARGNDSKNVEKHEQQVESSSKSDSQGQKEESSNPDDNVNKEKHEQDDSSSKESEGQTEGANVEHHEEGDSSVSQDVKDRTDLDTLPDSGNGSHSKDAIAK